MINTCSIVSKAYMKAKVRKLMCVSSSKNNITSNGSRDNLTDNVFVCLGVIIWFWLGIEN